MTTITDSAEPEQAAAVEAEAAAIVVDQEQPQLLYVDPAELIVGVNTRTEVQLDKNFLASIRQRGVREPIAVRRDTEGRLVVRKGKQRTLAAVQEGLALVPVFLEPEPLEGNEAEVDRIIDQLGENQHRSPISDRDEVAAHQQLQAFGLSAAQIARRTSTAPKRVRTTLAVAASDIAAKAMGRYELTVDQAAVIAEFGEEDETVTALVAAAKKDPGQFPHVAQRARDARAQRELRQKLTDELAAEGIRVIEQPDRYMDGPTRRIDVLRAPAEAAEGEEEPDGTPQPGQIITEEEHAGCPGRVAWLTRSWRTDGPPLTVTHGCENWEQHGHVGRDAHLSLGGYGPRKGKLTEQEKAERRTVRVNNDAWRSATKVRQAWLRQFLARKTAPKDAATWSTVIIAQGGRVLSIAVQDGHDLALDLLGLKDPEGHGWYAGSGKPHPIADAVLRSAAPGRAAVLTLAMLLGAYESACDVGTWRNPDRHAREYFTVLRHWGYELADVERLVLGEPAEEITPAETPDADAA